MGTALVKIKVMPVSPDTDLSLIKEKIQKLAELNKAKNVSLEQEPIAFGLEAIIISFSWNEDDELENFEKQIKEIEDVTSVDVIDMRRAFG